MESSSAAEPTVRERIMAAGLAMAEDHGITRLSMGDVAKAAGVSRQTVYRYFPAKEQLVAAVVEHEAAGLIAAVVGAAAGIDDPTDALEAALTAAFRGTRDHVLLDRLLRTEPETLLPLLTGRASPVTDQVRRIAELVLAERIPEVEPADLRRLADLLARLLISFAVNPPDEEPEVTAASVAFLITRGSTTLAEKEHP
jgi:AcrR family transcriptional regulator